MASRIYDGVVPEPPSEAEQSMLSGHSPAPEQGAPEAGASTPQDSSSAEEGRGWGSHGSSDAKGRRAAARKAIASRSVRFHEGELLDFLSETHLLCGSGLMRAMGGVRGISDTSERT